MAANSFECPWSGCRLPDIGDSLHKAGDHLHKAGDSLHNKELPEIAAKHCSFCGANQHETDLLIAATGNTNICNECVGICNAIIRNHRDRKKES